ncbi:ABC transporter ATP-binding protein [Alteromonadaceae bacterium M269]|nr:ABC transporter ATP-binding protein [Alteromonadaceae bacterium M269]
MNGQNIDLKRTRKMLLDIVRPDRNFLYVALVYGLAISLLTLAVPIAVQTLINTVVNIASTRAITILAGLLFLTLAVSGALSALRTRVMELFERRIYARLTAELSLKTMMAQHSFFEGRRNTTVTQRYFDIMTLQKNIPALLIDGFALVLQMIVGFTLVSFYHSSLFAFNAVLILVIYLIWMVWGRGAQRTAIKLSYAKYDTAKWLSDMSSAHDFFKSSRHMDYAGKATEGFIADYVDKHKHHFKYTFAQTIMFLMLYALASSLLLGLGGWLVVKGELSIGQLVAAELILFAIFFGFSQFSNYLKLYYELFGAADKIGDALDMPQESIKEDQIKVPNNSELQANKLQLSHIDESCMLDFKAEAGSKLFVITKNSWIQQELVQVLRQHAPVRHGWIRLGGLDIDDYDVFELRQAVASIDRSLIVECSIKEYLRMAAPDATVADIKTVLERVRLDRRIASLENDIDTTMSSLGSPLLPYEFLLLKLAAAFLSKPQLIVLNQHFDNLPADLHQHLLGELERFEATVFYFTHHPIEGVFDTTLSLENCISQNSEGNGQA